MSWWNLLWLLPFIVMWACSGDDKGNGGYD